MQEIWKDIPGYEDDYQISSYGNLRSKTKTVPTIGGARRTVTGKLRKTFLNKKGYLICTLSKGNKLKTFTVHQLVCLAHMDGFIKGTEINHIDGNKANPRLDNLEVSNPSHNQLHAVRTGLVTKRSVSRYHNVSYIANPKAKCKWAGSIRHAGKSCYGWKTFMTEEEAALYVNELLDSIGDTERNRNVIS